MEYTLPEVRQLRRILAALLLALMFTGCASIRTGSTRFAFVRDGNLWLRDGGKERHLTQEGRVREPRFSHDGQFVAYGQGRNLMVIGAAGSGPWVIPEGVSSSWSPTADTLAISGVKGISTVAITARGPETPRLVTEGWEHLVWSPDGQQMAVDRRVRRGTSLFEGISQVGIVARSGGNPRVILEESYPRKEGCVGGPSVSSWSADGHWLLLVRRGLTASMAADCNEFAVISVQGGTAFTLGVSPNPRWAVWEPGATRLAFVDGAGRWAWEKKQLRLASPPWDQPALTLTPAGYADRDPAWHPAGRYLAFTRSLTRGTGNMNQPSPGQTIYTVDVTQPTAHPVPGSEGGFGPFWGTDGALFWFKSENGSAALWQRRNEKSAPLISGIDLNHSYYGQWNWPDVIDSWEDSLPTNGA